MLLERKKEENGLKREKNDVGKEKIGVINLEKGRT